MKLYSNEIVFRGHPDKVCDQISGAILDACLKQDKSTKAGIEVMGGAKGIYIAGELTTKAKVNFKKITRRVLKDVGYSTKYKIHVDINKQSPDIALGVDIGGAGDQGMMFGYACNDNKSYLPDAMVILIKFAFLYDELRKKDNRFLSDGKAQITGEYDENFKLIAINDFTISYQNTEINRKETDEIIKNLARKLTKNIPIKKWHINPTGKFKIGGFEADSGLTGRKIVVDAYQSFANVGGGCMNGKDPSKVDISGAHMARKLACEILKEKKLKFCTVQLSYAIGIAEPLAIYIESDKGNITPKKEYYEKCKPQNMIKELNLLIPQYENLAKFGHFINKSIDII